MLHFVFEDKANISSPESLYLVVMKTRYPNISGKPTSNLNVQDAG